MQRKTHLKQSNAFGNAAADGILGPSLSSRRAPKNDSQLPKHEPISLYDITFANMAGFTPPAVAFFDQFSVLSAPGSHLPRLDIFWLDSNKFIVCSQGALGELDHIESMHLVTGKLNTDPRVNLFAFPFATSSHAKYSGVFKFTRKRESVQLHVTDAAVNDKDASLGTFRDMCRAATSNKWTDIGAIRRLLDGQEAMMDVVRLKYKGEDQNLLREMQL